MFLSVHLAVLPQGAQKGISVMPLEIRKNPDGSVRPYWYGRYEIHGRRYCDNLGIRIAGTPPPGNSLKGEGDSSFERSRARALSKLADLVEEAKSKKNATVLMEKIYERKTGEQIRTVQLKDLPDEWAVIRRRRPPNERYARQCRSTLSRFSRFLELQNPNATELAHITRSLAQSFMDAEAERNVTSKTWNDTLKLLRATCKHLLPPGAINPFSGIPLRDVDTVFRKPFTPEELKAILDAAAGDNFIRPVIVTGICTAMRRGDCCLLKWTDVDLTNRFITVKTAKTGTTVAIPIVPLLYKELTCQPLSATYVFPKQAAMYLSTPDGITQRVRKVFASAGFRDPPEDESRAVDGPSIRGEIHAKRGKGLRLASIRDFHSFRVTWITIMLTAGVPLEIVQRVTGHKTIDVVLKHYFQPGREEFRSALQNALPQLLLAHDNNKQRRQSTAKQYNESDTPLQMTTTTLNTLKSMTAKDWKSKRDEAIRQLSRVSNWIGSHIIHAG